MLFLALFFSESIAPKIHHLGSVLIQQWILNVVIKTVHVIDMVREPQAPT